MLAEVAAFESDRFSESWQETHAYRVEAGLPATGTPRWGYIRRGRILVPGEKSHYRADPDDQEGERYEPDPALRDLYVSLYERYVAGTGGPTLVTELNFTGIRTIRGTDWTTQTFFRVLDSGFAAGLLRKHDPKCRCDQRGRCQNVIYTKGAQPAIIKNELWDRYLVRRKRQRNLPPRTKTPSYPLSGLLRCGGCRRGMTAVSGSRGRGRGYAYRCNRWKQTKECTGAWVLRTIAEQAVLDKLAEWAVDIEKATTDLAPRTATRVKVKADVDKVITEIARVDRALVRLTKLRALDDDESPEADAQFEGGPRRVAGRAAEARSPTPERPADAYDVAGGLRASDPRPPP